MQDIHNPASYVGPTSSIWGMPESSRSSYEPLS